MPWTRSMESQSSPGEDGLQLSIQWDIEDGEWTSQSSPGEDGLQLLKTKHTTHVWDRLNPLRARMGCNAANRSSVRLGVTGLNPLQARMGCNTQGQGLHHIRNKVSILSGRGWVATFAK